MIPSGTVARFLPLKRLKTRIASLPHATRLKTPKARLHAQPACCHGNVIAHRHGLFSLRFVRFCETDWFWESARPRISSPMHASLSEHRLAQPAVPPKLLLKGRQAFTLHFLSWQTRDASLKGTAAGSEVTEGSKIILGSHRKQTGKCYGCVNRGRLYGGKERSGQRVGADFCHDTLLTIYSLLMINWFLYFYCTCQQNSKVDPCAPARGHQWMLCLDVLTLKQSSNNLP